MANFIIFVKLKPRLMRKLMPLRQAMSLLLLCLPAFLFAQSTLTLSTNSPRVNDKMERKVIAVDIWHLQSDKAVYNTNYYPYGNVFCDGSSTGYDVQPYKYNGKELDLIHGLNTYDYGARQLAMALPRWDRVDPLAAGTPGISPYVYCENNPVNAVDPDGKKIFIIGNRQERISILKQLQKLTNDKLGVRNYDGSVIIISRGTKNMDKNLESGTSLVNELINHKRNLEIQPNEKNNKAHDHYRMDAWNGKGTDVYVYYNQKGEQPILTRNPKTGKIKEEAIPLHIILGHELIHGHRSMNGVAVFEEIEEDYIYTDKNMDMWKTSTELEELETVGIKGNYTYTENKLRKEHNLNKRIKY